MNVQNSLAESVTLHTDITCAVIAFSLSMVIHVVKATAMLDGEISAADFSVQHEENTTAFSNFLLSFLEAG